MGTPTGCLLVENDATVKYSRSAKAVQAAMVASLASSEMTGFIPSWTAFKAVSGA